MLTWLTSTVNTFDNFLTPPPPLKKSTPPRKGQFWIGHWPMIQVIYKTTVWSSFCLVLIKALWFGHWQTLKSLGHNSFETSSALAINRLLRLAAVVKMPMMQITERLYWIYIFCILAISSLCSWNGRKCTILPCDILIRMR